MPAKLNSEFNYRYQVDGNTPWEKIKILKGFLEGRVRAAVLEEVAEIKYQAKLEEIEHLKNVGAAKHLIMVAHAELIEVESFRTTEKEAYELNRQEIAILEKLLAELYVIAEPTRISGYTDEQMFEANAANEFTVWVAREIHAELLATGHPSPAKLRNAMLYPGAFEALQKIGLIPAEANIIAGNTDPLKIELDALPPKQLMDGNIQGAPKIKSVVSDENVTALFPIALHKSKFTGDVNALLNFANGINYSAGENSRVLQSTDKFLLNQKEFAELKNFIELQLDYFATNILQVKNRLRITQSWINKAEKGKGHHYHTHPNSFISGIFYIYLDENNPNIIFYDTGNTSFNLSQNTRNQFNSGSYTPFTQAGDLLLFPSHLPHSVPENQGDNTRYSLSFNTFPVGDLGGEELLTYVDL